MSDAPETKPEIFCSFCGQSQHKVKKIITGPSVAICVECVDLCCEIAHEGQGTRIDRIWAVEQANRAGGEVNDIMPLADEMLRFVMGRGSETALAGLHARAKPAGQT